MTIEQSDRPCPDCEHPLQVIYVTELQQVVSGWACPECGYLDSEKNGIEDSVDKPVSREFLLRIEKPLSDDDVRDPLASVEDEFRARARAEMADDEVWLLIDPDEDRVVDARLGDDVEASES
ncbi:hypothetical protein [Salinibaculum salinum]|uniref:hypothetical protein n=1 Tax=Salinibaculum salinum TaxID=3131996 RepID=UPI0030EDAA54